MATLPKKTLSVLLATAMMLCMAATALAGSETAVAGFDGQLPPPLSKEQIQAKQEKERDGQALADTAKNLSRSLSTVSLYSFDDIPESAVKEATDIFNFFLSSAIKMPDMIPGLTETNIRSLRLGAGFAPFMVNSGSNQAVYFPILLPTGEAVRFVCIDMENGQVTGIATTHKMVDTYNLLSKTSIETPIVIVTDSNVVYAAFISPENGKNAVQSYLLETPGFLTTEQAKGAIKMRSVAEQALSSPSPFVSFANAVIGYESAKPPTFLEQVEGERVGEGTEEVLLPFSSTPQANYAMKKLATLLVNQGNTNWCTVASLQAMIYTLSGTRISMEDIYKKCKNTNEINIYDRVGLDEATVAIDDYTNYYGQVTYARLSWTANTNHIDNGKPTIAHLNNGSYNHAILIYGYATPQYSGAEYTSNYYYCMNPDGGYTDTFRDGYKYNGNNWIYTLAAY